MADFQMNGRLRKIAIRVVLISRIPRTSSTQPLTGQRKRRWYWDFQRDIEMCLFYFISFYWGTRIRTPYCYVSEDGLYLYRDYLKAPGYSHKDPARWNIAKGRVLVWLRSTRSVDELDRWLERGHWSALGTRGKVAGESPSGIEVPDGFGPLKKYQWRMATTAVAALPYVVHALHGQT